MNACLLITECVRATPNWLGDWLADWGESPIETLMELRLEAFLPALPCCSLKLCGRFGVVEWAFRGEASPACACEAALRVFVVR